MKCAKFDKCTIMKEDGCSTNGCFQSNLDLLPVLRDLECACVAAKATSNLSELTDYYLDNAKTAIEKATKQGR